MLSHHSKIVIVSGHRGLPQAWRCGLVAAREASALRARLLYRWLEVDRNASRMSHSLIDRPVLYSTMTFLAYNVNLQFYSGMHYTWCTPYFSSDINSLVFTVPPSSSPLQIYYDLKREVEGGDLHGTLIKVKRLGIRRGADAMLRRARITAAQRDEIFAICQRATPEHFRPVLCVLPKSEVIPYVQTVPVKSRANPLSQEYIVADVPTASFDVIKFG